MASSKKCDWSFSITWSQILEGWDGKPFISPCNEAQDEKILLITVAERSLTRDEDTYQNLQRRSDQGQAMSAGSRKWLRRYKRQRRSQDWIGFCEAEVIERKEAQNSHGKTASLVVRLKDLTGHVAVLKPEENQTYVEVFSWGGYEKMTQVEYNRRLQQGTIVDERRVEADYREAGKRWALRLDSIRNREQFLPTVKMLRDVGVVGIVPRYDGFWFKKDEQFLFYDERNVDSCRQYVIELYAELQYEEMRKEFVKRYKAVIRKFELDKIPHYFMWLEIDRDEIMLWRAEINYRRAPYHIVAQKNSVYGYNSEDLRGFILNIEEIRQLLEQNNLVYKEFRAMYWTEE